MQQAIAGEEIGVGDQHLAPRAVQREAVVALDVVAMLVVVANGQQRLHMAGPLHVRRRGLRLAPREPGAAAVRRRDDLQRRMAQRLHHRPLHLDGVVLLGLRPEVEQLVSREVDAADEAALAVDDDQLAVQAVKRLGAQAPQQGRLRVEEVQVHAGAHQRGDIGLRQAGGAVAVDRELHAHAALRGGQQHALQLEADLVLEQDEGLDQHLALCTLDGAEHGGEELLAVLEQAHAVAVDPLQFHSSICAASGAWSDRCDQGWRGSTIGWCTAALRT